MVNVMDRVNRLIKMALLTKVNTKTINAMATVFMFTLMEVDILETGLMMRNSLKQIDYIFYFHSFS